MTIEELRAEYNLSIHMEFATLRLNIFADYFQFLVMDEECEEDLSTLWTEEALRRMLAVGRCVVAPGTLRNVDVAAEVHVLHDPPRIDLSRFDHAASGSLDVRSGCLVVMPCTGYLPDAPRIRLSAGTYQVLSLASGIGTIRNEWEPADDLYTVYLWRGDHREPELLKHWRDNALNQGKRMAGYHTATFRLLGTEPEVSAKAVSQVEDAERRLGFRLPASVREWYCNREAIEILAKYSNQDRPIPLSECAAQKWNSLHLLPFKHENQGVCTWSILLDGSDDPPVYVDMDSDGADLNMLSPTFSA